MRHSIEGAGRHDRRVFLSMAMVELARISAKEGFSGAIEVRRSCGGERSDAGAISEKIGGAFRGFRKAIRSPVLQ